MIHLMRTGLMALTLSLASLGAQATPLITVSPLAGAAPVPADPTASFATSPELTRSLVMERYVSLSQAIELLTSTEGAVWRVVRVQAPDCAARKGLECQSLKTQCKNAKKFVQKTGGHAACSTLYAETTVLLVNDKQNPLPIIGD